MCCTADYYSYLIVHIETSFTIIVSVLFLMSIIGNTLIYCVYTSKYFRITSTGFYCSCLALVETVIMALFSTRDYFGWLIYTDDYAVLFCKFFIPHIYIFVEFSSWIRVIISIDQLILVNDFKIARHTCKKTFQIVLLIAVFLILITVNTSNFVLIEPIHVNDSYFCEYESIRSRNVRDLVDLVFSSMLPFLLMTYSGARICINMLDAKRKIKCASSKPILKKVYRFSVTILGLNLIFVLLNLPICVTLIVLNFQQEDKTNSIEWKMVEKLTLVIANSLTFVCYSCGITIHLALNRKFRSRTAKMLHNGSRKCVMCLDRFKKI